MYVRGRGKGPGGMTTKEAIFQVIEKLERATGKEIFNKVKNIHEWKDNTILRHIMGQTINLQPGYYEWSFIKEKNKCLFLCEDGYFEKYDKNRHGIFEDGIRVK